MPLDSLIPRLLARTAAHEGPVHVAEQNALYVTVPGAIRRIEVTTAAATDLAVAIACPNGMFDGGNNTLLVCDQGSFEQPARIARLDLATCAVETVIDSYRDMPLSSPNDVVVGPDGVIWFTDPSYGHLQGFRPEPALGDFVHRYDPRSGVHSIAADGFDKPNGIAISPDGSVLYVTDSGAPHHIEAFDVTGTHLRGRRLFTVIYPGHPDGLKVDRNGFVYASAGSGVQVYDPDGDLLAEIHLPGAVNFCFSEPDHNRLFITADDAVWVVALLSGG